MPIKERDKRQKERINSKFKSLYPIVLFEDPADLSIIKPKEAEVVDISETGMGLHTSYPLKIGRKIIFSKNRNWRLPKDATVIWSVKQQDGYRAGIKFDDLQKN